MSALRGDLRDRPPFVRAEVHYTRKLEEFVARWSRVMTLCDVADLAGLSWDTAKRIVKRRLRRDYGRVDLHGVKHLSIDEIYVGRRRGYYTLVLDLDSGRILWVSPGRGKAGLQGFWRRLRRSRTRISCPPGSMWMSLARALIASTRIWLHSCTADVLSVAR